MSFNDQLNLLHLSEQIAASVRARTCNVALSGAGDSPATAAAQHRGAHVVQPFRLQNCTIDSLLNDDYRFARTIFHFDLPRQPQTMHLRTSRDNSGVAAPLFYRRLASSVAHCLFDSRFFATIHAHVGSICVVVHTPSRSTSAASAASLNANTRLQILLIENRDLLRRCAMDHHPHRRLTLVFVPCMTCFDALHDEPSRATHTAAKQSRTSDDDDGKWLPALWRQSRTRLSGVLRSFKPFSN